MQHGQFHIPITLWSNGTIEPYISIKNSWKNTCPNLQIFTKASRTKLKQLLQLKMQILHLHCRPPRYQFWQDTSRWLISLVQTHRWKTENGGICHYPVWKRTLAVRSMIGRIQDAFYLQTCGCIWINRINKNNKILTTCSYIPLP